MSNGSRGWIYAGAAASTFRIVHKFVGRQEEVYRVKLRPGDRFEIRELAPPTKTSKRAKRNRS
jgi:hypothetical protein